MSTLRRKIMPVLRNFLPAELTRSAPTTALIQDGWRASCDDVIGGAGMLLLKWWVYPAD